MKESMTQLTIRQTVKADIDRAMEILDSARRFMRSVGNTSQWPEGYPSRETIERDVEQGHSYMCCNGEGTPVATFCFAPGPDATYAKIEDGEWLNDRPYHVIHRIASDGSAHGVGSQIIAWCRQREENLRIDTHSDNKVMQSLLERNGFVRCGIIHVADGTPRIAYQSAGKMQVLYLVPERNRDIFQKLIFSKRISANGHLGTHMDCYTCLPEQKEYDVAAEIVDCSRQMPDTDSIRKMTSLHGKALILHTGNLERNGYGTEQYFNAATFLSDEALHAILEKRPLFIIIDSHGLGESGKRHVSIDKTCEEHHCHVIENADLSSLEDEREISVKICIDTENASTGKPCRISYLQRR